MIQSLRGLLAERQKSRIQLVRFLLTWMLALSSIVGTSTTAHAQGNATLAEALFDEGRTLFEAREYDKACAKFKESQRLDPATGTLLNLAICYEKAGRLATAWATWREAASSARAANQPDREEHARDMAKKLEGKLARLTITVKGDNNIPAGFWVTEDGTLQPPAAWGVSLPVDAGTHHLEAGAPGFLTWKQDVSIKDGQNLTVAVPILALEGTVAAPPPPPAAEPEAKEPEPQPEPADEQEPSAKDDKDKAPQAKQSSGGSRKGLKIAGIALTAGGAVGLTAGAVFGIRAVALNEQSKSHCSDSDANVCSFEGTDLRDKALTSATVSNVLIGVGAAALTTGVVLLIVSKKKSAEVALAPTPWGGHLTVSGAF